MSHSRSSGMFPGLVEMVLIIDISKLPENHANSNPNIIALRASTRVYSSFCQTVSKPMWEKSIVTVG